MAKAGMTGGRALALALAVASIAPLAAAHIPHDRPHLQPVEADRSVETTFPTATTAQIDLVSKTDPLVDLVRHTIDPTQGIFEVTYRRDASDAQHEFRTRFTWLRMIEYRDANADGIYENGTDTIVRSWPMTSYQWEVAPWRQVFIGGVQASDTGWAGNASSFPPVKFEIGVSGTNMSDEGANVAAQDVIAYVDMKNFPDRGAGDLYALEGRIDPGAGATPTIGTTTDANGTVLATDLLVQGPGRLAFFDWGAQATLDGTEQDVNATLGPADASGGAPFYLDFPIFDKTLHMVLVVGAEYANAPKRSPDAGVAGALAATLLGAAAAAAGRRRA
jgi:hypothetical protein